MIIKLQQQAKYRFSLLVCSTTRYFVGRIDLIFVLSKLFIYRCKSHYSTLPTRAGVFLFPRDCLSMVKPNVNSTGLDL